MVTDESLENIYIYINFFTFCSGQPIYTILILFLSKGSNFKHVCVYLYQLCVCNTLKLKVSISRIKGRVYTRELCSMLCGSLDERGVCGRMITCIHVAESLGCSPETITILLISYMPIQNKKQTNKKEGCTAFK